jgi:hypothetical protein
MTAMRHRGAGGQSLKRRSPTPDVSADLEAARSSEFRRKAISRAGGIGLTVVPLTLCGGGAIAAATVRTWPAVVAMAVVLICSLAWVGLGPTISYSEIQLPSGRTLWQLQLTFARRAPLPRLSLSDADTLAADSMPGPDPPQLRLAEPVPSPAVIRKWAREQGQTVPRYGPLPAEVRRAWDEANVSRQFARRRGSSSR